MAYALIGEINGRRLRLTLSQPEMVLGKDPGADLVVAEPTVSRRHCQLQVVDDGVLVSDLNSSNGVRLNGRRLREPATAKVGDRVRVGELELELRKISDSDTRVALATVAAHKPAAVSPETTLAPMALDRFSLQYLPGLLRASRQEARVDAWCQEVAQAFIETLPLASIQIGRGRGGSSLAKFGNTEDGGQALSYTFGDLEVLMTFKEGEIAARYRPLGNLLGELLGLVSERPANSGGTDVTEAILPSPASQNRIMRRIYRRARQIAGSDIAVLILGESGTGKELLAQFIHQQAGREGPFVAINCGAIPGELLEAELLGIDRGVATGVEARAGKFEQAHGGTLFLDEIGDMPPETQAAILRVLQEGEVTRVGGSQARPARPRVIAATNKALDDMVASGSFRVDLLHRIADWEVTLPPLRERGADLAALALHFLTQACDKRDLPSAGISEGALNAMYAYRWPGNVRELQREMNRIAVFLGPGDVVTSDDLRSVIRGESEMKESNDLAGQLASAERGIILRALESSESMSKAAERLGIARSTLYRRMEQLGITSQD